MLRKLISTELKIPVAWGHVAAKVWGDSTNKPVIALHGLIDNAGTFDTLVPLLPRNFYYICVDLPGHGLSSHFPPGLPIHYFDFAFALKHITDHFNQNRYTLLAHSFGGKVAFLYSQLFPQLVSKVAVIDSSFVGPNRPADHIGSLKDAYKTIAKTSIVEQTPSFSYEEVLTRVQSNRFMGSLTRENAEQIARRMIRKVGDDKYQFTYDRRLRSMIHPSYDTKDYVIEVFKRHPIQCPAILIQSKESMSVLEEWGKYYTHLPNIKLYEIEGHHHSHHTNPEQYVDILTEFLTGDKSKL